MHRSAHGRLSFEEPILPLFSEKPAAAHLDLCFHPGVDSPLEALHVVADHPLEAVDEARARAASPGAPHPGASRRHLRGRLLAWRRRSRDSQILGQSSPCYRNKVL